jgi:hypothetical protein
MKKQKRYSSESLIIRDIDSTRETMEQELAEAEQLDKMASGIFAWCGVQDATKLKGDKQEEYRTQFHEATKARDRALTLRRNRPRRELKLRHLKETLSAFKTQPFSFMPDAAVTVQPIR